MRRSLLILPSLVLLACGSSASNDPVLTAGGYSIPVPSGWVNASSDQSAPGKVAIKTIQREPPVLVILSPAPEPMPFDPLDPVACGENGRRMPGVVGEPAVITLPAGRACAVKSDDQGKLLSTVVFAAGNRGAMVQCVYSNAKDASMCDGIFKRVAVTR